MDPRDMDTWLEMDQADIDAAAREAERKRKEAAGIRTWTEAG